MCIRPFFPQMKISTARLEPEKKKKLSPSVRGTGWTALCLVGDLGQIYIHMHTPNTEEPSDRRAL